MTTPDVEQAPDPTQVPNPARIYNYSIGGSHYFPVDQQAAEYMFSLIPSLPKWVRMLRDFLAARGAAAQGGRVHPLRRLRLRAPDGRSHPRGRPRRTDPAPGSRLYIAYETKGPALMTPRMQQFLDTFRQTGAEFHLYSLEESVEMSAPWRIPEGQLQPLSDFLGLPSGYITEEDREGVGLEFYAAILERS